MGAPMEVFVFLHPENLRAVALETRHGLLWSLPY
jgi:hypothetical protein